MFYLNWIYIETQITNDWNLNFWIFHFRLSEMSCDIDHHRQDDDVSLTGKLWMVHISKWNKYFEISKNIYFFLSLFNNLFTDHYSSMQSLPIKSAFTEFECETVS